jgi:regulatory protein
VLSRKRAPEAAGGQRGSASAYATAVSLLARRDYASGELSGKLRERGFPTDEIAAAVLDLRDQRLLDDQRYAGNFLSYRAARGQGPARIRRDLEAAGVAPELISATLAVGPDWAALARKVRTARFGAEPPSAWREKAQQSRFLHSRGFSTDHIRSALGPDFDPDS